MMRISELEFKHNYSTDVTTARQHGSKINISNEKGCVVAIAHFFGEGEVAAYISSVSVIPTLRGRGLGTRLLLEVDRHLKKKGTKFIELVSTPENVEFYKKAGYEIKYDMAGLAVSMAKCIS